MTITSLNQLPQTNIFRKGDVFVLFGELFGRGYASGLVGEARKAGMEIPMKVRIASPATPNSRRRPAAIRQARSV